MPSARAQSSPSRIARAARPVARACRLRRPADRQRQHDPRDPRGLDRARPRRARLHACARSAATARCSPARWRRSSACAAWWCRRRPACSRPSACSTPRSSTTTARTFRRLLRSLDLDRAERRLGRPRAARRAPSSRPRASPAIASRIRRLASLHYQGQTFDLTVPVAGRRARRRPRSPALEEAFGREHERTYGHRAGHDEPVELTEIRVIGTRHRRAAR